MRCGILLLFFIALCYACKERIKAVNKFGNATFVEIADFQDRRLGDSLIRYLKDVNPKHRAAAAAAFASIQDSSFVSSLKGLLKDTDVHVRNAAAYAIGQTPAMISTQVLADACLEEHDTTVLATLIEAYGKVARRWNLELPLTDSILAAPLAWSYYRMAVRGLADETLNERSAALLHSSNATARLAAAHFFARGAKDFDRFANDLADIAKHDTSPDVRMAAVLALGKMKSDSVRPAIADIYRTEADHRIRVNAIRALNGFAFDKTKAILLSALNDSVANVGIAASEVIKSNFTKDHWSEFSRVTRSVKHWRIQANLYEALLAAADHKELTEEIIGMYKQSSNPYHRASLLGALQHAVISYPFVRDELVKADDLIIKVAAASSLVAMNYKNDFPAALKPTFAKIYEEAVNHGDAAVTGIVANALGDSVLNYRSEIKDYNFLRNARNRLSLPKDFESIVPLDMALAYFEGRKSSSVKNEFNHPVDWKLVQRIPSSQTALIKTSKGDITIRLLVDEAPGSVANFVSLAMNKYYDGKFVHRVVPNFVVQGGCPRGDGFGSEAYSIRSEFYPRRYKTGSVGMASAGKDTEGTQWFITHSPTPHLEGRYTIFAEVVDGMDVVHKIEIGDRILSAEIIGLNLH